jgi:hypothetical protein
MRRKHKHLIYTGNTVKGDLYQNYYPFCDICKGLCRDKDSAEYIETGLYKDVCNWNSRSKPRQYCKHNPVLNRTVYTVVRNARRRRYVSNEHILKLLSEDREENRKHIKEAIKLYSDMKEFKLWDKSRYK